jgi:hypothetical protein
LEFFPTSPPVVLNIKKALHITKGCHAEKGTEVASAPVCYFKLRKTLAMFTFFSVKRFIRIDKH